MFQGHVLPLSAGCMNHVSVMPEGWMNFLTNQSYETLIGSVQVLIRLVVEIPCNLPV